MAELSIRSTLTLNDGNPIPRLGFGVFQLDDPDVCETAVLTALEAGYRHIDAAYKYGNEAYVGNALAKSRIPREDLFLTTKTTMDDMSPGCIKEVFAGSLDRLRTDYVDLFLVHWPMTDDVVPAAWDALIELRETGACRSIGVCNFSMERFEKVFFPHTDCVPAVNQIEMHIYNRQQEVVDYCRAKGMIMESYSSLARGCRLNNPGDALVQIAEACNKSVPQVMLRYLLQSDIVVLVKSQTPKRIIENANVFDFELTDKQMTMLKALDEGLLVRDWAPEGYY